MAGDINTVKKSVLSIFDSMEYGKKIIDINLAREWLNNHKKIDSWINGKFFKSKSAEYEIVKGWDGTCLAEIVDGTTSVEPAVESAIKAQLKWEAVPSQEKSNLLNKISKNLQSSTQLFNQLNSLSFQKNDFSLFVNYFTYYSDWALLLDECKNWKPYGVVLVVLSSDSPLHVLGMTVASALAAGCSVILKPSRKAPFCAFLFAQLLSSYGLPDGLVNVVPGSKTVVEALITKKVAKILFFGNHLVAERIRQKDAAKSFSFLNFHQTTAVVLDSCDLTSAVDKIFSETWDSNFHSPFSVSTVIVQESISQVFLDKFKRKIKRYLQQTDGPSLFKNKKIAVKIKQVVENLKNNGVTVETNIVSDEIWGPIAVVECQSEDVPSGLPILTVLICRNAKEAVSLANHSRYALGCSIWTDISAQALEVASNLKFGTIWINCHGICDVDVPLQPLNASGDGVFGGRDGIFEFMYRKSEETTEATSKHVEDKGSSLDKSQVAKISLAAQGSFNKWKSERNRKKYLNDLADLLASEKELSQYTSLINYWAANSGKYILTGEQNKQEFVVLQNKEPLGVVAVLLNDTTELVKTFFSLIPAAIAMGNAVILVTPEENLSTLKPTIQMFLKSLPSNLFTCIPGYKNEVVIASDPNINAIWLHNESLLPAGHQQLIKQLSQKHFKHLWITSNAASKCKNLFGKECLRNKVIWLPKVHQFP